MSFLFGKKENSGPDALEFAKIESDVNIDMFKRWEKIVLLKFYTCYCS